MSSTPSSNREDDGSIMPIPNDPNPPTIAAFSPVTLSHASNASKIRSTILVHQKSPLLIATPPQVTRALAYSHPFLLPLNKLMGLLTWTSGDPWESFLLLAGFWAVVLYGDVIMRYAGPVVVVAGLMLGLYSRRYSPLSSTGWTGEKQKKGHKREISEATNLKHQKTLDEIVETLRLFTSRCNVLLDPLLHLTDFLSTQRTATTATTRPALTTLFIRILLVSPFWIILSVPAIAIITTKRIAIVTGTIFITWHSRPAQVSRAILWRSSLVRKVSAILTGLDFPANGVTKFPEEARPSLPPRKSELQEEAHFAATKAAKRRPDSSGVRFTFIIYENQRRWVGLGWTTSLFAYERSAWTDEHGNPTSSRDEFELPDVEAGNAQWRWMQGSKWLVDGAAEADEGGINAKAEASDGGQGWIYYDNKWQTGRRGVDGWGKYTRRRKWYRDAELVETTGSDDITPLQTPRHGKSPSKSSMKAGEGLSEIHELSSESISPPPRYSKDAGDDNASIKSGFSSSSRGSGFRPNATSRRNTRRESRESSDELVAGLRREREADWGIGDDVRMGLE